MCSDSYFPVCTTVSLSVLTLVFQVLFLTSFVVGFSFCQLLFYPCCFLLPTPRKELLIFIGTWFSPWSSLFRIILAWIALLCEMRDYLAVTFDLSFPFLQPHCFLYLHYLACRFFHLSYLRLKYSHLLHWTSLDFLSFSHFVSMLLGVYYTLSNLEKVDDGDLTVT